MLQFTKPLFRRDFIRIGSLSAFGLGISNLLRTRSTANAMPSARAKSCILIWLDGGPSHLDTFDPKPQAPAEIRGPFSTISTNLPGEPLSELLPETAKVMDRISIVRSVTSPLGEHNFGAQYMLTGYKPTPALDYPTFGSAVAKHANSDRQLPPNMAIPNFRVGGAKFPPQGFLDARFAPFEVGGDPANSQFKIRDVELYPDMTDVRLNRRRDYLNFLNKADQQFQSGLVTTDPIFEQAYRLMTSPKAKRAFDLSQESIQTRQRYGGKTIGQSCLLARRLVESGVPFVTVNNTGWDTHNDMYTRLKEGYTGAKVPVGLTPSLDTAFSALIRDLDERNLLNETLVVVMGEFGRTPKLNPAGGRDHWPRVFSVVMAGAGIPGGQIIGQSDSMGESPNERPVKPSDLAATIYTLLGIDPRSKLYTRDGRPVPIVLDGIPVEELRG